MVLGSKTVGSRNNWVILTYLFCRVLARSVKADGVDRLQGKIKRLGFQADKPAFDTCAGAAYVCGKFETCRRRQDELAEIQQARESNEASETVVKTTFIDNAELVWKLTESFTQEQAAKAMGGWSRAQVSQYAMLNKLCKEAWDIVATSFKSIVAEDEDSAVAEVATNVAIAPFTEGLLRNILDLDPMQQLSLCQDLAAQPMFSHNMHFNL